MQSSQPLVSVVIPSYNHEQFVQDTIQSVIDQDYENIELIIIDDGSKDSSVEKIREMIELCQQRFVRFEFRSRTNIGLSATLNEALEWCEGKYFSALASDDQIIHYKTRMQVEYLEKNQKVVAVFGGVYFINDSNEIIEKKVNKYKVYDFKEIFMHKHDLPAPTQMIVLEALKEIQGFNVEVKIEDWFMLLKLSSLGKVVYLDKIYSKYRQHANNFSHNIDVMQSERLKVINLFNDDVLYGDAKRRLEVISINEYILVDKKKSLILLLKYIRKNKIFLINPGFFKIVLKYIRY